MGRGALPGRKPGDARAAGKAADGVADGAVEAVGRDLDLEEDGALGGGGRGHLHRTASIGWVAGPRPRRRRRRAAREEPLVGEVGLEPTRRSRGTGS